MGLAGVGELAHLLRDPNNIRVNYPLLVPGGRTPGLRDDATVGSLLTPA